MRWTHGSSFGEGGVSFRLWAPGENHIELVIEGRRAVSMTRGADGFHEVFVEGLSAGARYRFALANGRQVPDPASRCRNRPSAYVQVSPLWLADNGCRSSRLAPREIVDL